MWKTESMQKFVDKLLDNDNNIFTFRVGIIPPGYYEKIPGIYGYSGEVGPSGKTEDLGQAGQSGMYMKEVKNYPENYMLLQIDFTALDGIKEFLEELKSKLIITPGGRNQKYDIFRYQKIYEKVPTDMGVYKRPGFNVAYQAMRLVLNQPYLTMKKFAKYGVDESLGGESIKGKYNNDLVVHRKYDGDVDLLEQYVLAVDKTDGKCKYTINILSTDIEKNEAVLLEYLRKLG